MRGEKKIEIDGTDAKKFKDGVAPFYKEGKWGLIDKEGTVILKPKYDVIEEFSEGRAVVGIGEYFNKKYGYIDTNGKEIVPVKYDSANDFEGEEAYVNDQGTWYYIDKNGKCVSDCP